MTKGTKIVAIDFEVAKNIITNEDLTKILDTSDEWISTRTGIKKRRVLSKKETSTTLGIEAAKKVIKRANYNGNQGYQTTKKCNVRIASTKAFG